MVSQAFQVQQGQESDKGENSGWHEPAARYFGWHSARVVDLG